MEQLQEKVNEMLNGEKKRREIALKWLEKVTETIKPVCFELYGNANKTDNIYHDDTNAVWLRINNERKKYYFRYGDHWGENPRNEGPGFYGSISEPYWGDPVEDMKGSDFWEAIRTIMRWLPELQNLIDAKQQNREEIINLLNYKD